MKPKSILITGCSSGIGQAVALGLQARGYRVFATARHPDAVARLQQQGLESLQLDVDDSASIQAAVAAVLQRTGGTLDALFNNAGYGQFGAVEDLSRTALRAQFETNVFGVHELTCQVLPVMLRQGQGRIIQHSSLLGFVALPLRGAYNASKFALEGLTDTLRLELAGTGVQVSLIEPGPISSRFRANSYLAYQRHIQPTTSRFAQVYARQEQRLQQEGAVAPFTLGPEAVLACVIHALESRHPRPRYRVTRPSQVLALLRRVLSTRRLDRVLLAIGGREAR